MKFEFIRFLVVGVINTLVGLSIMFLLLHGAGLSYWVSTFIGNTVGAGVSFVLNRNFTFRSKEAGLWSVVRFVCVILFCYVVSYQLGSMVIEWVAGDYFSEIVVTNGKVLFSTGLYTVLNYLLQRIVVFRERRYA
ncbi:polysaccharide biosynthesis protein GtrA [Bacillus sp. FJAT-18017]|uniref:GtrA family protein n=1 Tax=Bacillus sp. FJAT-18017 TaxID=1705566 RepID=UPI0006AEB435|nr:GtrA family protein [Bacillus sp. FJAT-18017]ALC91322.1 polysaccharide biosynthesis protein GtrA [Bacillus sp. FJAT-18017]